MTPADPIRLTKLAKRAGCAAKHPPGFLLPLLGMLAPITDPNVIVGNATADDAAIYKISEELALVLTTDFFTPIVDDPRDFGRIAAANAISDVYAMGGTPRTALSIVGFPDGLPVEILQQILAGAQSVAAAAGIAIVGGHTIKSEEPIFGLAVVGDIHPKKVLRNDRAQPGDRLILTKPIGLGIITTAAKNDQDSLGMIGYATELMTTLNRAAAEVFARHTVNAMTDVTGFGLLGNLRNITAASRVSAEVVASMVPIIPAAKTYAEAGIAPGGTRANHKFLNDWVHYASTIPETMQLLLCDAQTSGGLLATVPESAYQQILHDLHTAGVTGEVIGSITGVGEGTITVIA